MKTLSLLSLCLILAGCGTTPVLTPAQVTQTVSTGILIGLEAYPQATPEVTIAGVIICAEAAKTNVNPQVIAADLAAAGVTNSQSRLIVNGGLLVFETAINLAGTNVDAALPYLQATCEGFRQALPSPIMRKARVLPPHL